MIPQFNDFELAAYNFDILQKTPADQLENLQVAGGRLGPKTQDSKASPQELVKEAIQGTFAVLKQLPELIRKPSQQAKIINDPVQKMKIYDLFEKVKASEGQPSDGFHQAIKWANVKTKPDEPLTGDLTLPQAKRMLSPPTGSIVSSIPADVMANVGGFINREDKEALTQSDVSTHATIQQTDIPATLWKAEVASHRPQPWDPEHPVPDPFQSGIDALPPNEQEFAWRRLDALRTEGKEPWYPTQLTPQAGWLALPRGENSVFFTQELPDGRIVTSSENGSIRLWSAEGTLIQDLETPQGLGRSFLLVLPDGTFGAAGFPPGVWGIWSPDGTLIAEMANPDDTSLYPPLPLPGGRFAVLRRGNDPNSIILSVREEDGSSSELWTTRPSPDPVPKILPNGGFAIVSADPTDIRRNCVQMWGPDGQPAARLSLNDLGGNPQQLTVLPNGRLAIVLKEAVRICDIGNLSAPILEPAMPLAWDTSRLTNLVPLPDGTYAVLRRSGIDLWNPRQPQLQATIIMDPNRFMFPFEFNAVGRPNGDLITMMRTGERALWRPNIDALRPTREESAGEVRMHPPQE